MTMNMTPDQLRILTDFIAAAGAAIGGKGSVGDLVGQQVHKTNDFNRQQQAVLDTEERHRAKNASAAEKMARVFGMVKPDSNMGGKGPLKSLAGPDASKDGTTLGPLKAQSPLIEALGGFTPKGEPGITGLTVGDNGELTLKGNFDLDKYPYTPSDFGPDSNLNSNDIIQALYGSRMIANEPMEQQLKQLQLKKGEESLLSPNEKMLREVMATQGLDLNELVDIGGGLKLPRGKLAEIQGQNMQNTASMTEAMFAAGGDDAEARRLIREGLENRGKNPYFDPATSALMREQGQMGAEIGTTGYMSKLEETVGKDVADQQDSYIAISSTAKPEDKIAATKRRAQRRNRLIQNDLAARYRGQQGISFKRIDMGDGAFGYGVFKDGAYTGEVFPAY